MDYPNRTDQPLDRRCCLSVCSCPAVHPSPTRPPHYRRPHLPRLRTLLSGPVASCSVRGRRLARLCWMLWQTASACRPPRDGGRCPAGAATACASHASRRWLRTRCSTGADMIRLPGRRPPAPCVRPAAAQPFRSWLSRACCNTHRRRPGRPRLRRKLRTARPAPPRPCATPCTVRAGRCARAAWTWARRRRGHLFRAAYPCRSATAAASPSAQPAAARRTRTASGWGAARLAPPTSPGLRR